MPPPGPPWRKTSGLPSGLPHSSKWIVCSLETFRDPERYGFVLGKRSRRRFVVGFMRKATTHALARTDSRRGEAPINRLMQIVYLVDASAIHTLIVQEHESC